MALGDDEGAVLDKQAVRVDLNLPDEVPEQVELLGLLPPQEHLLKEFLEQGGLGGFLEHLLMSRLPPGQGGRRVPQPLDVACIR